MINLTNTAVPNVPGKLRDAFIAECSEQGIDQYSTGTMDERWVYLVIYPNAPREYQGSQELYARTLLTLDDFTAKDGWEGRKPELMTEAQAVSFLKYRYSGVRMEAQFTKGHWAEESTYKYVPTIFDPSIPYRKLDPSAETRERIAELENAASDLQDKIKELKETL